MTINNKQDVIRWLKRLREDHPLSHGSARKIVVVKKFDDGYSQVKMGNPVDVYTDQIIKDRYADMIEYLESEEVA